MHFIAKLLFSTNKLAGGSFARRRESGKVRQQAESSRVITKNILALFVCSSEETNKAKMFLVKKKNSHTFVLLLQCDLFPRSVWLRKNICLHMYCNYYDMNVIITAFKLLLLSFRSSPLLYTTLSLFVLCWCFVQTYVYR